MNNIRITGIEKFIAITIVLITILFNMYSYHLVSGLIDVFSEMEINIPQQTNIVMATFRYWFVFTLLGLIGAFLVIHKHNRKGWWLLIISGISVFILLPITVWSMYAPVL